MEVGVNESVQLGWYVRNQNGIERIEQNFTIHQIAEMEGQGQLAGTTSPAIFTDLSTAQMWQQSEKNVTSIRISLRNIEESRSALNPIIDEVIDALNATIGAEESGLQLLSQSDAITVASTNGLGRLSPRIVTSLNENRTTLVPNASMMEVLQVPLVELESNASNLLTLADAELDGVVKEEDTLWHWGAAGIGFETNESYRKLKSQDRIQVRDVIDSLSELFENYMVSIDEEQGFEWNYQGFSRSSGEIFPIFEKFLKSPAGKFLAEEQRQFGDTIIQIYLEFLDILKELSSKSESFSKNLWNEIRQTKSVVTGGIYEFDGKNMFTSTVDSYVVKTFLSVFPSIEKKSQASIEDIRKLLILTIGLRAIDINKYNNLVYDQKLKNLTFKKIMSDEKIKPTMKNMKMLSERDNSRSFQIDKNNGTTSYRFDSKMNENDYVFVSVEDKLVDRKWFPNISEKFSDAGEHSSMQ